MLSTFSRAHSLEIPDAEVEFPTVNCDLDTPDLLEICISDELWIELPEHTSEMEAPYTNVSEIETHHGSGRDDLFESVDAVAKEACTPPLKRSKRISSKAKIDTLRSEVKRLSSQLQQLSQEDSADRAIFTNRHRIKMWKQIATRQLEQRQNSEMENAKLRVMLKLQIEEALSLKRVLKRRKKLAVMADMLRMPKEARLQW
ncbi:hypothetical protein PF010_g15433 [Phytophthora fragariae]|uniref:Uncharacterized protein n=3 Tax=Phytophthora TaxID=4783 RepID=A0A6A3YEV3_9STRA|nr:hypothetical protein PF003_g11762 [Phytophthora fragariae]KAE9030916.1 hypothetical protein PR002_g9767 [Phytophthora rubi]KAE8999751.1 hypothetical protein PF011_g14497 [Phytophthora fragariae]KAE9034568.1 hypothetical protein PR001_g9681 [Phytophthora rubi]KAE9098791.1 hypothetical protein PF010_g15433 [Phytophthora fragariae]